MLCNFIEITLWHGCSPVNLLHIFRTPLHKNSSGWLLLLIPVTLGWCLYFPTILSISLLRSFSSITLDEVLYFGILRIKTAPVKMNSKFQLLKYHHLWLYHFQLKLFYCGSLFYSKKNLQFPKTFAICDIFFIKIAMIFYFSFPYKL